MYVEVLYVQLTLIIRTMFTTLNKADVCCAAVLSSLFRLSNMNQHAKRKRILADRYANSNIMKSASVAGVQERSSKFLRRCVSSPGGVSDIFVSENVPKPTYLETPVLTL